LFTFIVVLDARLLLLVDRLRLLRDAAAGLAWAHSKDVVHRDVRLANFLIRNDAEWLTPLLLESKQWKKEQKLSPKLHDIACRHVAAISDFGLSRLHSAEPGSSQLYSRTTNNSPTPWAWDAPEVFDASESGVEYSTMSDVFMFGVSAVETIAGVHALEQYTQLKIGYNQVFFEVTSGRPPPLLRPDLATDQLWDLINR
jgi:serine/threonine protein kinase